MLMVLMASSSVESSGDDIRLEDLLVNIGLGGTRPATSKASFSSLSGEPVIEVLANDDCCGRLSCILLSVCLPGDWPNPIGDGDRSLRAPTPKNPSCASASLGFLVSKVLTLVGMAGTGMESSGVGGTWLKRGCID